MCHERWVRQSEVAVQRSWLRELSQRDREDVPVGSLNAEPEPVDDEEATAREPVAAADR